MTATLSHSVTALLPVDASVAEQEELLLRIARHRNVVFHDVLRIPGGEVPVRVERSGLVRLSPTAAPAHVGKMVVRAQRELFESFIDTGDTLIPGWGPHDPDFGLTIRDEERVVADLEDMAQTVADALRDLQDESDADPEALSFLYEVGASVEIARAERLPLVAHW